MKSKIFFFCLMIALLLGACTPAQAPAATGGRQPLPMANTKVAAGGLKDYADVRDMDLTNYQGTLDQAKIQTLWMNDTTRWPASAGPIASDLIERGKNPGLGVRALHQQGITGKGVNVAIIDQNLVNPADHPEFKGKIAAYKDFGTSQGDSDSSMHGPAVTSLLVGETIGTAPGARVYYAAAPSWLADAKYYADALDWIVAENAKLPAAEKIRVVSVSAGPSGKGSMFTKNGKMWDAAYQRATQAGILVLDCTEQFGMVSSCYYDLSDPESVTKCTPGYPGANVGSRPEHIHAPTSPRTTAEEYTQGFTDYQYTGQGGLSWAIPYVSGVLAMGWQLRPELTSSQMVDLLFQTAAEKDGMKIINPPGFIEELKKGK